MSEFFVVLAVPVVVVVGTAAAVGVVVGPLAKRLRPALGVLTALLPFGLAALAP